MVENLTKMKGKRNVYRRHFDNLIGELTVLLEDINIKDEHDLIKLTTINNNIKTETTCVKVLDEDILNLLQQDDMETELGEILKRDDDLETYLVREERLLEKEKRGRKSPSPVSNRVITSVQSVVEDKRVKLPKLEIQKFDGNVLNWSTFSDRFTSSIDDATGINEVEKFNYLLGLLSENTKSCISGLTLTSENYHHAKAILKERSANPQVIISAHMESFVKMPNNKKYE